MFRRRKKAKKAEKEKIPLEEVKPEEFEEETKEAVLGEVPAAEMQEVPLGGEERREEVRREEIPPIPLGPREREEAPPTEEIIPLAPEERAVEEREIKEAVSFDENEPLTEDEVEREINNLKGKIPSFILRDLKSSLEGRIITRGQFEKIKGRILETVDKSRLDKRIENVSSQVGRLSGMVESIGKMLSEGKESLGELKKTAKEAPSMKAKEEEEKRLRMGMVRRLPGIEAEEREIRLVRVPHGPTESRLVLKWLSFLMEKVGYEGCIDALNHYVDIGWVSEDAYIELSKLVRSLASSWDERAKPLGYLTPNDHLRSLLFIEELMGKRREVVEEA